MSLLLQPWCITQGSSFTLSSLQESSRNGPTLRAQVRINVALLMRTSWLRSQSSLARTWWLPKRLTEQQTIRPVENRAGKRREELPCKRRRSIMRTGTTRSGTSETARGTKDLNFTKLICVSSSSIICTSRHHPLFFILGQHIHSTVIYEDSFKKKFANC